MKKQLAKMYQEERTYFFLNLELRRSFRGILYSGASAEINVTWFHNRRMSCVFLCTKVSLIAISINAQVCDILGNLLLMIQTLHSITLCIRIYLEELICV